MPAKIEVPNTDNLIARYVAGESCKKLAEEWGIDRSVLYRLFREKGVPTRGRFAAELVKWSRMSPEQRANQVRAAHYATRGIPKTNDFLVKRAKGVERALTNVAPIENVMSEWLRDAGLPVTQQKAIGIYNVDIAIDFPSIAVEIFGGGWHSSSHHKARHFERCKYILNLGWDMIIIWVDARRYPLGRGAYDYLIKFVNFRRLGPTSLSEYRVILGDGHSAPTTRRYLNSPADIERLSPSY
jgi:very-short-patch-repair endonuclease